MLRRTDLSRLFTAFESVCAYFVQPGDSYLAGVRLLKFGLHGSAGVGQELCDIGGYIVPVIEAQYAVGIGSTS